MVANAACHSDLCGFLAPFVPDSFATILLLDAESSRIRRVHVNISWITDAFEARYCIFARGALVAVVTVRRAFVDERNFRALIDAVSFESLFAFTRETLMFVNAKSIKMTVIFDTVVCVIQHTFAKDKLTTTHLIGVWKC